MSISLVLSEVKEKLSSVVSESYEWPEPPKGWQIKFIAFPDGNVDIDFLHPVSDVFWSEENGLLEPPFMNNGKYITANHLKSAGIPYMTTFGCAAVSESPKQPHLKRIK